MGDDSILARQQRVAKFEQDKRDMRREKALFDAELDLAMSTEESPDEIADRTVEDDRAWRERQIESAASYAVERVQAEVARHPREAAGVVLDWATERLGWTNERARIDALIAEEPVLSADIGKVDVDGVVELDPAKLEEVRVMLADMTRQAASVAARAINMGVLHTAGCEAPGRTVSATGGFSWTITPENARNDAIRPVSDGQGGLIMKCFECESTTPLGETTRRRRPEPTATAAQAVAAYTRLGSDRKAAAELGISRTQLRRLRGVQE